MAGMTWVTLLGNGDAVQCSWETSPALRCGSTSQVIDLHLTARPAPYSLADLEPSEDNAVWLVNKEGRPIRANAEVFGSENALRFLLSCLHATGSSPRGRVVRLIVPLQKGTITRSDVVSLRLKDANMVDQVVSFSTPLQLFSGELLQLDAASLPELFRASAGGVLLRQQPLGTGLPGDSLVSSAVEADFEDKMSMPWVLPDKIPRKRLVLVGCSYRDPSSGGWTPFVCEAALALGIDLIIIEKPGSWLERDEYSHWYEALLPAGSWWTNPPEDGMADRIAALVSSYGKRIDGIITFYESFQSTISRAAQQLGLPSQPAESYDIATDKYKLGIFEGREPFYGSTADEALDFLAKGKLSYPVILKPCLGFNSEGVMRVNDATGIQSAIEIIQKTFFKSFTMEKYCDGPEVDVNIVLLDKEVLFCEICDDYPKLGDLDNTSTLVTQNTFLETSLVCPSALPPSELKLLRESIRDTIVRLGFTSGMWHVEARVDKSSVEYRSIDGIMDLRPVDGAVARAPVPWIIEINPRPPGLTASRIVESVYGIDYSGVALLLAINDDARVKALSRPFLNGAQYTGVMVLIGADFDEHTCEGIFDSDDICEELLNRRPDLARNINRYGCLAKKGQRVPHSSSGTNTFIAYFNVFSTKSRQDALEIATEVRGEVRYSFR
ncbi:glutathione synthetase ATP-binding domain-like protein [Xylariaceae sp. FL0662B]|nr:glutathione synthetase ATP-binding domain-like protein [Xylariaceae sp. FL0662B]